MQLNKLKILIVMTLFAGGLLVYYLHQEYVILGVTSGKVIQISKKDSKDFLNIKQLKKIEYDYIPDTKYINGPSLLTVLNKEGIKTFREVELKGPNGSYTFKATKPDVDQRVVFFFTEYGTVNLGLENNYDQFLVKNVNQIYIK